MCGKVNHLIITFTGLWSYNCFILCRLGFINCYQNVNIAIYL